jgi:hypothetical protein
VHSHLQCYSHAHEVYLHRNASNCLKVGK